MREFLTLSMLISGARDAEHVFGQRLNGEVVLWGQVYDDVYKLAAALKEAETERTVLACEDIYRFAVGLMAALLAEKHIVLPPNLQPRTLSSIVDECGGVALDEAALDAGLARGQADAAAFGDIDTRHLHITLYTSGSSGQPSAVTRPVSALEAEVGALDDLCGGRIGGGFFASSVAHYHAYGVVFQILWPLCEGAPIALERVTSPETLHDWAAKGAVHFISSPAFLTRYAQSAALSSFSGALHFVISAGSALPVETAIKIADLSQNPVIEIYGSTETGIIATRDVRSGEAWTCLAGAQVRTRDDTGVLEVCSPYIGNEGWQAMADCVDLAPDGRFSLEGRSDRIVKVHEKRVSLSQMEALCAESDLVEASYALMLGASQHLSCAAVLSEAGRKFLEHNGKRAVVEAIKGHLRPSFDLVLLPRKWRFVEDFPRNNMGKILHADIVALFEDVETQMKPPLTKEYELIDMQVSDGAVVAQIFVPENLLYFDGHFDEMPILPGVAQAHWAIDLARTHLDIQGSFSNINVLKFVQVIVPNSSLELRVEYASAKGLLTFSYSSAKGAHSQGKVKFT